MEIYVLEKQNYDGNDVLTVSIDIEHIKEYTKETINDYKEYGEDLYLELSIWKDNKRITHISGKDLNDYLSI